MTGTLLNQRYRIMRPLGKGGMGAVYEAVDLRLNNTVAVKHMTAEGAGANRAFEREARLLASLRYPALPVVIDHFTESAGQFLVMQYIEGEDLAHALSRSNKPFNERELVRCAVALAGALAYLHGGDPPIIHRDLKPHNIKRTPAGEYVLLDFGLATGSRDSDSTVAAGGRSIYGYTPQYSPPEQIDGLRTDQRSDIFAFGATLFHLATALPPPPARERRRVLESGTPDPLAERLVATAGLEPRLRAVIARALALDPRDRFQSASEILALLVGNHVAPRSEPASEVLSDRRRVDAALPSQAEVRRAIDLIVQVRFANSPILAIEDWPSRRKPDRIEQASETLDVRYPTNPDTGELLPARLRIRIVTPDFVVTGTSDHLVDVPPRDYSKRLAFLLTPVRPGFCRVNVEVFAVDAALLGMIAIETEALEGAAVVAPDWRVANLDVRLVVERMPGHSGVPVRYGVEQIGPATVGIAHRLGETSLDCQPADQTPIASASLPQRDNAEEAMDRPTVPVRDAKSYSYLRPMIIAAAALVVLLAVGITMLRPPAVTGPAGERTRVDESPQRQGQSATNRGQSVQSTPPASQAIEPVPRGGMETPPQTTAGGVRSPGVTSPPVNDALPRIAAEPATKAAEPVVVEVAGIPRRQGESPADYGARAQRTQANMRNGIASMDQEDFTRALTLFQAVQRDQAGYMNIDGLIADTTAKQKRQVDTAIDNGQQNERADNLINAIRWYERALRLDPNSAAAREKLAAVADRRTKLGLAALERAEVFRKRNDTDKALAAYQEAADLLPSTNDKKAVAQQWVERLKR